MADFDALGNGRLGQDLAEFLAANGPADLASLVVALAMAARPVAAWLARVPLDLDHGADASTKARAFADRSFETGLLGARSARAMITEERESPTWLNAEGQFLVALDPIEAASNIDIDMSVGSIFSILDARGPGMLELADCLQPGHRQRAAGIIIYGPHTSLVFSVGAGTHVATLDPATGVFRMTSLHLRIPEHVAIFSINAANARHWPGPVRAYVEDCLMGETGPRAKNFNMRWVASLAADAYRVLRRGGSYLFPDDARPGYAQGRLRLLFEANPVAMLIEQAGGLAIDGVNRILDIPPKALEARTPLIFGSTDKVELIRSYYVEGFRSAARAPLFGKRGLLRG
jgi:fructose-1,6-bisphosphatase I